jgi:hypothetical protein
MTESIVVKRLVRNLKYKLTYVRIFEDFAEAESDPEVVALLESLIEAQKAAIAPLSSYLRTLDVNTQELELNDKLLDHAASRTDTKSRLRFIHDGLNRAVSWYKMQLVDRQMNADPELRQLLVELGEIDAAKLWRTEAVMGVLRVSVAPEEKDWEEASQPEPREAEGWRPRLVEDVGRPAWGGKQSDRWSRPSRYRGKDPTR